MMKGHIILIKICTLSLIQSELLAFETTKAIIRIDNSPYTARNKHFFPVKNTNPSPKMHFLSLKQTEEEENSMTIARHLTCPSCQAVAFQLHKAFSLAHKYRKEVLSELKLLTIAGMYYHFYNVFEHVRFLHLKSKYLCCILIILDSICTKGTFDQYKLAYHPKSSTSVLAGPGLIPPIPPNPAPASQKIIFVESKRLSQLLMQHCHTLFEMPDDYR